MQKIEYFAAKIYKVLQFFRCLLRDVNALRNVNFNFFDQNPLISTKTQKKAQTSIKPMIKKCRHRNHILGKYS